MKALNIFEDISKDMREKDLSRRGALREGLNIGLKSALLALPLALTQLKSNKAYAQSGTSVLDVLNYALTLEYLEAEFYQKGLDSSGLIPGERSEEHTSELQSLMRISYAVFCLKKNKKKVQLN